MTFPLPAGVHPFTRRCPVPGCAAEAANGCCMCLSCWRYVAAGMRDLELAAFKAWSRDELDDAGYAEVLEAAVLSSMRGRRADIIRAPRIARPGFPMRAARRIGSKPAPRRAMKGEIRSA